MRCRKQFRFHKIPITNLWEVYLDEELWKRVCTASDQRKCSRSWITRYCVFRLARKKNLRMSIAMEKHSNNAKDTYRKSQRKHRHILCLYGDDEKLLRIAAMHLGITVSHLIRLSLHWFLPKIESMRVYWNQIYYHGTKLCQYLDVSRCNLYKIPFYDHFFYAKWPVEKWWKRAWPIIPIPNTPDEIPNDTRN